MVLEGENEHAASQGRLCHGERNHTGNKTRGKGKGRAPGTAASSSAARRGALPREGRRGDAAAAAAATCHVKMVTAMRWVKSEVSHLPNTT